MNVLRICLLAGLCALAGPAAWCYADTPAAGPQTVTLAPERARGRLITPAAAAAAALVNQNRYAHRLSSTAGSLSLANQSVAIRIQRKGRVFYLGVDADGDGTVSGKEYRQLTLRYDKPMPVAFVAKAGGAEMPILVADMTKPTVSKTGVSILCNVLPGSCHKGQYAGQTLRVVDDNLDGQITQDGKDALIVGNSVGVPLLKRHAIGRFHVELKVSAGGDTIEVSPLPAETKLGVVKLPMNSKMVKALVLTGSDGAYDVASLPAGMGIPEGEYKLAYGAVADSKSTLLMVPSKKALTYPIQGGKANTLRIGRPLKANFVFRASGDTLQVSPYPVEITGIGEEVYTPIDYGTGGNSLLPQVLVTSGTRVINSGSMEYT